MDKENNLNSINLLEKNINNLYNTNKIQINSIIEDINELSGLELNNYTQNNITNYIINYPIQNFTYSKFTEKISRKKYDEINIKYNDKEEIEKYKENIHFLKEQVLNTQTLPITDQMNAIICENQTLKEVLNDIENEMLKPDTNVNERNVAVIKIKQKQIGIYENKLDELYKNTIQKPLDLDNKNEDAIDISNEIIKNRLLYNCYKLDYEDKIKDLQNDIDQLRLNLLGVKHVDITEPTIEQHILEIYDIMDNYLEDIENKLRINYDNNYIKFRSSNKKRSNSRISTSSLSPSRLIKTQLKSTKTPYRTSKTPSGMAKTPSRVLKHNRENVDVDKEMIYQGLIYQEKCSDILSEDKRAINQTSNIIGYLRGDIRKQLDIIVQECHSYLLQKSLQMEHKIQEIYDEKIRLKANAVVTAEHKEKAYNEKIFDLKKMYFSEYKVGLTKKITKLDKSFKEYQNNVSNALKIHKISAEKIKEYSIIQYNSLRDEKRQLVLKDEIEESYKIQYKNFTENFEKIVKEQDNRIKELEKLYDKEKRKENNASVSKKVIDDVLDISKYYENQIKSIETYYKKKYDEIIRKIDDENSNIDFDIFLKNIPTMNGYINSNVSTPLKINTKKLPKYDSRRSTPSNRSTPSSRNRKTSLSKSSLPLKTTDVFRKEFRKNE